MLQPKGMLYTVSVFSNILTYIRSHSQSSMMTWQKCFKT